MNEVAQTYAQLLHTISNYSERSSKLLTAFTNVYNNILEGKFLPYEFLQEREQYPKYPYLYPTINTLKPFNLMKIFHSTSDQTQYILDTIHNSDILALKSKYDNIPINDLLLDVQLQTSYFGDIMDDLYSMDLFLNFYRSDMYGNYAFETFGGTLNDELKNTSLLYLLVLHITLSRNLPNSMTLYLSALNHIVTEDTLNESALSTQFDDFIDTNETDFCREVVEFIVRYSYNIPKFSDTFIDGIINDPNVSNAILSIKTTFSEFIDGKENIVYSLLNTASRALYLSVSSDLIPLIYINFSHANLSVSNNISEYIEKPAFAALMEKYSHISIKQYMFLNYYYKFWPKKFLNILQLIIKEYVNNYIKPESNNLFDPFEMMSSLLSITNAIDWTELETYLAATITPTYLDNLIVDTDVLDFSTKLHLTKLLDEFVNIDETSIMDSYIDNVFNAIFDNLNQRGQVLHTVNYFDNRDIFLVYLKTYFRKNIFEKNIFGTYFSDFETQFRHALTTSTTITFDAAVMENKTTQLFTGMINKIHQFIENIYTSSITKKIIMENISYYLV